MILARSQKSFYSSIRVGIRYKTSNMVKTEIEKKLLKKCKKSMKFTKKICNLGYYYIVYDLTGAYKYTKFYSSLKVLHK